MIAIALLVVVVLLSGLTVKIGAVALRMTGLDEETASFQALSAFSRTGFTTREAERVMSHPARRRIVRWLIVLGNAGLVTTIASLVGSFSVTPADLGWIPKAAAIVAALAILYFAAAAGPVNRFIDRLIERRLTGFYGLSMSEFHQLVSLRSGQGVGSVEISAGNPAAGRTLAELALGRSGILVLAIERSGELVPTPTGDSRLSAGDQLICFGDPARMKAFAEGRLDPPGAPRQCAEASGAAGGDVAKG